MVEKHSFSAIIFDLDGVLIDTERHFKAVDHHFLQEIIPSWSAEDQRSIWGLSVDTVFDRLLQSGRYRGDREAFLAHYEKLADDIFGSQVALYPGALEVLCSLASVYPLGLCSSSPHRWIHRVLARFKLETYFTTVVSAEDVENTPKPAPQIYSEACRQLQLLPAQCVAVEDSAKGIRSANAAGCAAIGFRNGSNSAQDFSACVMEIADLRELLRYTSELT